MIKKTIAFLSNSYRSYTYLLSLCIPQNIRRLSHLDVLNRNNFKFNLFNTSTQMGDQAAGIPITNEEILKLCKSPDPATKDFIFQQTMYRIKDPRKSIPFYTDVLGMTLLTKLDFPEMKFTVYFLGFEESKDLVGNLGSKERTEWALSRKATLELTHNWGTENDPEQKYHNGNSDPRGYGHIGVMVPNVDEACARFENLGVNFIKRPQDGKMKTLAFISDPDGYWIEIFCNKTVV